MNRTSHKSGGSSDSINTEFQNCRYTHNSTCLVLETTAFYSQFISDVSAAVSSIKFAEFKFGSTDEFTEECSYIEYRP